MVAPSLRSARREGRTEDWGCGGRTPSALAICFFPAVPSLFAGAVAGEAKNTYTHHLLISDLTMLESLTHYVNSFNLGHRVGWSKL